jgi:hypothetical protein
MKKLFGVLVLLTMSAVCSSSFGYILVYDLTMPVKGVDAGANNTAMVVPLKGFLVMDVNEANEAAFVVEANLIMYGKVLNNKVYEVLSTNDANDFLGIDVSEQGEFFIVDLWSDNCLFNFESLILGKEKTSKFRLVPTATADNNDVATNLKGVIWVWDGMLLSLSQDITGTGDVSATLNRPHTASANLEEGLTIGAVTNDLIQDFKGKFTKVNLPVCDE